MYGNIDKKMESSPSTSTGGGGGGGGGTTSTDRYGSSPGSRSGDRSRSRSRSTSAGGGDGDGDTSDKGRVWTETESNAAFSAAASSSSPSATARGSASSTAPQHQLLPSDLSLAALSETQGPTKTSTSSGQKRNRYQQHHRLQHPQRHQHQFGLPPAPALPTTAFGVLPGISSFGYADRAGRTVATNERRLDHSSQQNQQKQQQQQQGRTSEVPLFGIGAIPAFLGHQTSSIRGDMRMDRSLANSTTTTTTTNINNYDDLFIDGRTNSINSTFLGVQQGSASFNAFKDFPHTAGTIHMPDSLVDRSFLYPFDGFDTAPSPVPTTSSTTEAPEFQGSTWQQQQQEQQQVQHSHQSLGQQAPLLKTSAMATPMLDLDPIRPPSRISQLPTADVATTNTTDQDIPSTKSKSDLELTLEFQMVILQQQEHQLILLQRQRQQQQGQGHGHGVNITANPLQRLNGGGSGSLTNFQSGHQSQQNHQQMQQLSVQPQVPILPWIDWSVLQANAGNIVNPTRTTDLLGTGALTNHPSYSRRSSSQSDDSLNLLASQHRNTSNDFAIVHFGDSNSHQFAESIAPNYQPNQASDKRQDRARRSPGNPKGGRYGLPPMTNELGMVEVGPLPQVEDPTRQVLGKRTSNMQTKTPVGESVVAGSTFQPHASKTIDRFKINDVGTVSGTESTLNLPETQPKADKNSKAATASTSRKDKVLKPLSAYNYFFTDERGRLVNESDGEDQRGARYTEERKLWLLSQHWSKDRTKRRRHRKTHGKIEFTELSRLIGQRWRDLPESEKDFYRSVAKTDMERYKKDSGSSQIGKNTSK